MRTGYEKRLDKSFVHAPVLPLYPDSKIVLFSDCHRGVGNHNDNFLKNQHLYFAALQHYYANQFTYIELGDGDELWENRKISAIREIHGNAFWLLSQFDRENRLYMLCGNHDQELKKKDPREFTRYPGIILKICGFSSVSQNGKHCIPSCLELYLTHGHQADFLNSTLWKLSRFLVRYLWKPLEQMGVLDPTSAAKNYTRKERVEKRLSHWAIKNDCYLITGHTHRPMLGSRNTRYFNTGSCVHPRCITCLEIETAAISLVKWFVEVRPDQTLYVSREVLAGPLPLSEL